MDNESIIKMLLDNNRPHETHKLSEEPILVDESFLFGILKEIGLYRKIAYQVWCVLRNLSKENSPILDYESVRELKRLSDIYEGFEHEKTI